MKNNNELINRLNIILKKNQDTILDYEKALGEVKALHIRLFFQDQITERKHFATNIKIEIKNLGGEPLEQGSVEGAIHRNWVDVNATLIGKDEKAIINECIRGEKAACEEYEEILAKEIPKVSNIRELLASHKISVMQAVERLELMDQKDYSSTFWYAKKA